MEKIGLDIWQVLILLGSAQTLAYAVFALAKEEVRSSSAKFLGYLLIFFALSNIIMLIIDTEWVNTTLGRLLHDLYPPIHLLVSPMQYLYLARYTRKRLNLTTRILLFAPVGLVVLLHLGQFAYKYIWAPEFEILSYYQPEGLFFWTNIGSFLFAGIIQAAIFRQLSVYQKMTEESDTRIMRSVKWFQKLMYIGIGAVTIGIISLGFAHYLHVETSAFAYPFFLFVTGWIYYLGLQGFKKERQDYIPAQANSSKKSIGGATFQAIDEYITTHELYMSPLLSLSAVAEEFDISSGYVSQLINTHAECSFNDYINQMRVAKAVEMLGSPDGQLFTVEAIAEDCGFNSKSSFYTAFKKFTGKTPKQYQLGISAA